MSPLQITGLAAGSFAGVTNLMILCAEVAAAQDVVPTEAGNCLTIAAVVGWVAFFTGYTRDQNKAHTDRRIAELHATITKAIEVTIDETENRLSSEWHLTNARDTQPQPPLPRRPHLVP